MVGRPYEYPNADARSPRDPNDFCPRDKILGLYNQAHNTARVRMSAEIEQWFEKEGRARKWVAFQFSAAGCTLTSHLIHAQHADDMSTGANAGKIVSLDLVARRRGR